MPRRLPVESRINAATLENAYRIETGRMVFFGMKLQTCSKCHRRRSVGQFKEGGTVCKQCRGERRK